MGFCLACASSGSRVSEALALSAHTPRVRLSVYTVSTCWPSELGWDTPSRYLASAGTHIKLLLLNECLVAENGMVSEQAGVLASGT